MQYLADTDWVINYQRNITPVVHRLDRLIPAGVGLSIISLAELYDGIFGSANPAERERSLLAFLAAGFDIVNVDA